MSRRRGPACLRGLWVLSWGNTVMGRHFRMADGAGQGYLMPPDARDWLPGRHLAWALLDVAAQLDLAAVGSADP